MYIYFAFQLGNKNALKKIKVCENYIKEKKEMKEENKIVLFFLSIYIQLKFGNAK
jgi:hypothetical protein